MKFMETFMELFFYFLFYFPSVVLPEYVLNLMIFWIRPIYRRLIKNEFWRNLIFKIGCLLTSKITLKVFLFVENISCWLLEYIILWILTFFPSNKLNFFAVFLALFVGLFFTLGLIGVGLRTQSRYAYKHLFLDENKNFWFWSDNSESFSSIMMGTLEKKNYCTGSMSS